MTSLAASDRPDARLFWFPSARDRGPIGELLVAATEAIVADPGQSASDCAWFRQDRDELQRRRDGITLDAAGLSDLTAALAKLLPPPATASSPSARRPTTSRGWKADGCSSASTCGRPPAISPSTT
jgi:hypothetical protein